MSAEKLIQDAVDELPISSSVRLVPVTEVKLRDGFANDTYFLMAWGEKPYKAMEVEIVPMIYVRRPEWWQVDIVGSLKGDRETSAVTGEYFVSREIWFWGTKGIEVRGKDFIHRIDKPENVKFAEVEASATV